MRSDLSPQQLAQQVADAAQARALLARERPRLVASLGGVAMVSLVYYAVAPLDMPLLAKLVLSFPAMVLPGLCCELQFLRRRLEAAVVLLRVSQESDR